MKGRRSKYEWRSKFEGIVPRLERRYKETDSAGVRTEIEKFMSVRTCPDCNGRRLRAEALGVLVDGRPIDALSSLPVSELRER